MKRDANANLGLEEARESWKYAITHVVVGGPQIIVGMELSASSELRFVNDYVQRRIGIGLYFGVNQVRGELEFHRDYLVVIVPASSYRYGYRFITYPESKDQSHSGDI